MIKASSMAVLALFAAGCTAYAEPAPQQSGTSVNRQCFWAQNVSGYRMGADGAVIVNTNARDYYALTTQNFCSRRLDFENRMALRSRGGNFICNGLDAEIYVPDSLGSTYCPVYDIRKLSRAEVEALRENQRR